MHVIEFQKRGLPHAHMLIWLHPNDRPKITEQIDKMVSAEILDPSIDTVGYEAVKNYMIHGPCGTNCVNSPCMVKDRCIKHFPKRYNSHTYFDDCGFPIYKRRKTGISVKKKGIDLDNRYVVPYNQDLLIRFQCHTNLEICNSSRSLKYLFKYCLKGHDTATMCLRKKTNNKKGCTTQSLLRNDRLMKSSNTWMEDIFVHLKHHGGYLVLTSIPGDLPLNDCQYIYRMTIMCRLKAQKIYRKFSTMLEQRKRKRGDVIGRLAEVHSSSGEQLYLRMLLLRIKGAVCFDDLKTVNGHVYNSFHKACATLGILQNDQQWHKAICENAHTSMPPQLRAMFVNILVYSPVSHPRSLWEAHWGCMSDDILLVRRHLTGNPNLCLSDIEIQNYALAEIEKLLNDIGKSLRNFPDMPYPGDAFFPTLRID
ncbi:uncharacterized protein LOC141691674 [Apium graveolens]|uniref:uncharacterized protein LOC141691674 n=1 Tax=Apium graveolens TaxID=4045 RepID=UPI003D793858